MATGATTREDIFNQHPCNPVKETGYKSQSTKAWVKDFAADVRLVVHNRYGPNGAVLIDFDQQFIAELEDDAVRRKMPANHPNHRRWRLEQEQDCVTWLHTEVSNIVLAGFPYVLQQSLVEIGLRLQSGR